MKPAVVGLERRVDRALRHAAEEQLGCRVELVVLAASTTSRAIRRSSRSIRSLARTSARRPSSHSAEGVRAGTVTRAGPAARWWRVDVSVMAPPPRFLRSGGAKRAAAHLHDAPNDAE